MEHRDAGFTIVEIMVVILLVGIIFPPMYALIGTINRSMQLTSDQAEAYRLIQSVADYTKSKGKLPPEDTLRDLSPRLAVVLTTAETDLEDLWKTTITVQRLSKEIASYSFLWRSFE